MLNGVLPGIRYTRAVRQDSKGPYVVLWIFGTCIHKSKPAVNSVDSLVAILRSHVLAETMPNLPLSSKVKVRRNGHSRIKTKYVFVHVQSNRIQLSVFARRVFTAALPNQESRGTGRSQPQK